MMTEGRPSAAGADVATVSSGITISGNVDCQTELQISGRVNGEVSAPAVFVEAQGEVHGGIVADRLRISGKVEGTIKAGDLAIEADGELRGEISYGRLKIMPGGTIEGTLSRSLEAAPKVEEKPVKLVGRSDAENPRRLYVD